MTTTTRQIKSFEGHSHEELSETINQWIRQQAVTPISIAVTSTASATFHAFMIYELAPEKPRSLGLR